MKVTDAEAALFSLKCLLAAMLAFYVALEIGLTRPYWAVTTSYIVAQPLAGAVLSKALFRLVGTALGAAAAVVLVPTFVNAPFVLSLALALWLGVCLYVSLLDRTPRAYVFLLAGYTASIIGFPSVDAPAGIFTTAILRVQEISIGILAGSLVHGVLLPRTVTARLFARVDEILRDAERWSHDALAGAPDPTLDRERRRLALDVNELHQLSIHLPFDTARFLPRVRTVRALQDQITFLLPLAASIEDRLGELSRCESGIGAPLAALVDDIRQWLAAGTHDTAWSGHADALAAAARALEPELAPPIGWGDMLRLNLLARLAEVVVAHRGARALRDQLRAPGPRPISPHARGLLAQASGRELHRDRGMALRSAFGTIATILLGSAFWIETGWADGAGAVLIAGVCCALFGSADQPGRSIILFLAGTFIGLVLSAIYTFAILPRSTDFVTLVAATAPTLLLLGSMLARPRLSLITLGALLGFCNTVGFNATYSGDFAGFVNSSLAQLIGTGFAVVTVALFQTIGTEKSMHRLVRAAWRDVARRAEGGAPDRSRWVGRMLDRVGLLAPRAAAEPADPGPPLFDVLTDLRTGVVVGDLEALIRDGNPHEAADLRQVLAHVSRFFRTCDPGRPASPPAALLAAIDTSADAFVGDDDRGRRREGLLLLTSLRRNLFPAAPIYRQAAA